MDIIDDCGGGEEEETTIKKGGGGFSNGEQGMFQQRSLIAILATICNSQVAFSSFCLSVPVG